MKFSHIVDAASALLRRQTRVSRRALKREFDLDEDALEDLVEELIDVRQVATDEGERILVWRDGDAAYKPDKHPGQSAERRQITVVFCDIVGSTSLSERLDPEDWRELLAAYQHVARRVVERYDGHVAQYLGDGVLVYFGWPLAHEDDAMRALRASLDLVAAVQSASLAVPLKVRIGIATGPVVVGESGDGTELTAAVGETPNVAARLQALAEPDQIVVAQTTRRLCGRAFEYRDLGAQRLKGISAPQQVWMLVGESSIEGRFEAATTSGLTPLVGREHELQWLLARWQAAKSARGQVVLVSGEPGIGKSRLCQALRAQLADKSINELRYQCSPYYTSTAFYPFIAQLEHAAGWSREETTASKLDKLEVLLATYADDINACAPLFAEMLSLPVDRYAASNLTPQKKKAQTYELIVEQISHLARNRPLLVIVEDAHWIDPTTQEVLTALMERMREARIMLLITSRPEYESPWVGFAHLSTLSVKRLSREHCSAMAAEVEGANGLPAEVFEQIIEKTDGVPLFVEELTKTVVEAGYDDVGEPAAYSKRTVAIPTSLHDSLMARLDRLQPGKPVAQLAACIGRRFSYELIVAVAPVADVKVDTALRQLVASELLYQSGEPPNATYVFKHALVQEAAYQSLLKSQREPNHARIAGALERQFEDVANVEPELLAHHYTEAGLTAQAIPYWQRAGERAVQRSAHVEAIRHFNNAISLLKELPETRDRDQQELGLQLALGAPIMATTGFSSAAVERIYTRSRELCDRVGDRAQFYPVLDGLRLVYLVRANYTAARTAAEQLLTLAGSLPARRDLQVEAKFAMGFTLCYVGDFAAARDYCAAGISEHEAIAAETARGADQRDPRVAGLCVAARALWFLGYPQQAVAGTRQALEFAKASGHSFSLAYALNFVSWIHQYRGEAPLAQQHGEAVMALAAEHGFPFYAAMGRAVSGWALAAQGQLTAGTSRLHEAIAISQSADSAISRSCFLALLAQAQRDSGAVDDALASLDEALAFVDETDERFYLAEIYRLKATLILAAQSGIAISKRESKAEYYLEKAIEVARLQQSKSLELRSMTDLARLWSQQNRTVDARRALAEIYAWFTEGFETQDLRLAKNLLEELRGNHASSGSAPP